MKIIDINNIIIEMAEKASDVPGWEVHRRGGMTVMVTPTESPNLNLCIAPMTQEDLVFATHIFKEKPFAVIHDDLLNVPDTHEVTASLNMIQMVLDFKTAPDYQEEPGLVTVVTAEELRDWANLFGGIVHFDPESAYTYLSPFLENDRDEAYIFIQEGTPVGTGHLYISEESIAQITSIAVCEEHRRKGIGLKIMNHTLARAQKLGAKMAALHAWKDIEPLYAKQGFKASHQEIFTFLKKKGGCCR